MKTPSFEYAKAHGFTFPGAREWITKNNRAALAQDAALITTPNTTVPVELTAYIDSTVIEIMTAPRRAREIFGEEKKGTWTTSYAKWRTEELTGSTTPYSDYANGVTSDVNEAWNKREQFIFQTTITYGDLELAYSSEAKINLASAKQKAAATNIDIAANKYYLLGVENRDIYGILNDPNLSAAVTPINVGTVDVPITAWEDKSAIQIYNDILKLFAQLQSQSAGLIDSYTPLVLCMSNNMTQYLARVTDHGLSVKAMLDAYLGSLKIVTLPELASQSAGETIFLIAPEVAGQRTGVLAFGEKLQAGRLIPDLSSFRQKFLASTYGGIVLVPFAFAQMTGIEE